MVHSRREGSLKFDFWFFMLPVILSFRHDLRLLAEEMALSFFRTSRATIDTGMSLTKKAGLLQNPPIELELPLDMFGCNEVLLLCVVIEETCTSTD